MGSLPTYLGIPIGPSFKMKEVWNPVLSRIRNRLGGWKGMYLFNLSKKKKGMYLFKGEKITLIKLVLACLPSSCLS